MKELRDQTTETINLYILDNTYRVCVEQYKGLHTISHTIKIGAHYPLWAGAGEKAMLAFQDEEFIKRVLETADNTKPNLADELKEIKALYSCNSINEEEFGSSAVLAPIFNIDGIVTASLSVSGPTNRFSEENIKNYQKPFKDASFRVSSKQGYIHQ